MGNTIYASFADPELAERAAGALLDFGVRAEDISVVQGHRGDVETKNFGTGSTRTPSYPEAIDAPGMSDRLIGEPNQFGASSNDLVGSAYTTSATTPTYTNDLGTPSSAGEMASATYTSAAMEDDTRDLSAPRDAIGSETGYGGDRTNDRDTDPADQIEESAKHGISTTTPEDAGAGAMKGAAWGAGIGVIAALASLAIPGFGLVAGGGALAIAIGGVVASTGAGAAAGAVTGYLKDQGVDGHVAEHYERTVYGGGALLAVTVPSGNVSEFEARNLMEKYGASNVNAYASRGYLA